MLPSSLLPAASNMAVTTNGSNTLSITGLLDSKPTSFFKRVAATGVHRGSKTVHAAFHADTSNEDRIWNKMAAENSTRASTSAAITPEANAYSQVMLWNDRARTWYACALGGAAFTAPKREDIKLRYLAKDKCPSRFIAPASHA